MAAEYGSSMLFLDFSRALKQRKWNHSFSHSQKSDQFDICQNGAGQIARGTQKEILPFSWHCGHRHPLSSLPAINNNFPL
jgi:hypothetical protein